MDIVSINIASVAQDTGISKDVLRMWERRYGFPNPGRDKNGDRNYTLEQVDKLCLIKRLMAQGYRPGKLLDLPAPELALLVSSRIVSTHSAPEVESLQPLLDSIRQHDLEGFQEIMQLRLGRQGLYRFVIDTVAPLTVRVGEAWEDGSFAIFEEHMFTEQLIRLLRQAISSLPQGRASPRIALTSVPGEQHILGLLMAEAIFSLEGATSIPLGAEMPLRSIEQAAVAHRADVVALTFSGSFPVRKISSVLVQLRKMLPKHVALWIGGTATAQLSNIEGVQTLATFEAASAALKFWREEQ